LARFCNEKLNEAEARIEMLQKNESGEPTRDAEGKVRQTPLDFEENKS
jgi:exonuclease VII small subunit